MKKKLLNISQFILLNTTIKSADPKKEENYKIPADHIIITDIISSIGYQGKNNTEINLGNSTIDYNFILDNINLFCDSNKNILSDEQKNFNIIYCTYDDNEITNASEINNGAGSLHIYISPFKSISQNIINVKIDNETYTNTEIKKIINNTNLKFFKAKKKISAIPLLNYAEVVKDGNNESINIKLTEEEIKKYFIISLKFSNDEELIKNNIITKEQKIDLKKNILYNKPIYVELTKKKEKVNLTYLNDNLKESIKELLENIKSGRTKLIPSCKSIVDALKSIQNKGVYKIVKDGTVNDLSNDATEITDNTKYNLTLPDSCYEVEITVNFEIKNNEAKNFKFKLQNIFSTKGDGKNKIKIKIDKNDNIDSIKKALDDCFELTNIFEKSEIEYKDNTNTKIENNKKFDTNTNITVLVPNDISELVVDKNAAIINIRFENSVKDKEFKDNFTQNYLNEVINNKYEDLVNKIKNILKTQDDSCFEIYKGTEKLNNTATFNDKDTITVKIIKNIDNILVDKKEEKKDKKNEETTKSENVNNNDEIKEKNQKKYCNCKKE